MLHYLAWFLTGRSNVSKKKKRKKEKTFMVAYEINLKRELTLKIEQIRYNPIGRIYLTFIYFPFNIKMHIYSLSFTNPRIINSCELPCFYDYQSPIWLVLFIDAVW